MLYGIEANGFDVDTFIPSFWREFDAEPQGREFADAAVRGAVEQRERVDDLIRSASTNWRLERMTRVDRNLLRLAAWELLVRTDIPRAVILDEAIELAKRFGGEESSSFVNGVLDRIAEDLGRVDEDREARS
jgi:N utilization substance protein B